MIAVAGKKASEKLLIIAGAGASAHAGYPCAAEFSDQLWWDIMPLIRQIGGVPPDLRTDFELLYDVLTEAGPKEVLDAFRERLVAQFGRRPEGDGWRRAWPFLLDHLAREGVAAHIVTTNYDPLLMYVADEAVRHEEQHRYRLATGREPLMDRAPALKVDRLARLATARWKVGFSAVLPIHGCAVWDQADEGIAVHGTTDHLSPAKVAVLWPGRGKVPARKPYNQLYSAAAQVIGEADRITVIGHSLRDPALWALVFAARPHPCPLLLVSVPPARHDDCKGVRDDPLADLKFRPAPPVPANHGAIVERVVESHNLPPAWREHVRVVLSGFDEIVAPEVAAAITGTAGEANDSWISWYVAAQEVREIESLLANGAKQFEWNRGERRDAGDGLVGWAPDPTTKRFPFRRGYVATEGDFRPLAIAVELTVPSNGWWAVGLGLQGCDPDRRFLAVMVQRDAGPRSPLFVKFKRMLGRPRQQDRELPERDVKRIPLHHPALGEPRRVTLLVRYDPPYATVCALNEDRYLLGRRCFTVPKEFRAGCIGLLRAGMDGEYLIYRAEYTLG